LSDDGVQGDAPPPLVLGTGQPPQPVARRGFGRSIQSASVYAIAAAGQRALTFLLLPVYTRALTPSEYGRVTVLVSLSSVTYMVLSMGFDFSVVRQYFSYTDDAQRGRFVTSVWLFQILTVPLLGVVLGLLVLLLVPTTRVFHPAEVATALFAATLQVVATTVPFAILRARQQLRPYMLLAGTLGIGNAAFTVLFVVVFGWGVIGWLLGTLAANSATLILALWVTDWSPRGPRSRSAVRGTFTLGISLVPAAAGALSLQLGDRLLLSGLVAPGPLGAYGLGANLAQPAQIALQSLNQGFMPAYARLQHTPTQTASLRTTITAQAAIAIWVGVCLSLVGPPLVTFIAPSGYLRAASVIGWLTLGYVFYGLSLIPTNGLTFILGRPRVIAPITLGSAAVNLAGVALLSGPYGIPGAAAASAIGYCVQFVLISWRATASGVRYTIDWRRIGAVVLWGALAYAAAVALTRSTGGTALIIRTLLAIAATVLIAVSVSPRIVGRLLRSRPS
jgi:O-antigen/teichoic acid export membrane protein